MKSLFKEVITYNLKDLVQKHSDMCSANIILKIEQVLNEKNLDLTFRGKEIDLKRSIFCGSELNSIIKILNKSQACKRFYLRGDNEGFTHLKILMK